MFRRMIMSAIALTKDNFEKEVLQSDKPVRLSMKSQAKSIMQRSAK